MPLRVKKIRFEYDTRSDGLYVCLLGMAGKKRSEREKKERLKEQKRTWIRKKREKMTEAELEERRQKDRERYKKKKEAGKIKSIKDYTPRMQKTIRKSWRERAKTHRNKLKLLKATEQRLINDETPPPKSDFTKFYTI
ncbi:hypothetical protein SFRURICE_021304 [Spodoptera frugiperda]|nr:hypothetical protein SFRURICE_021304 [Spodoptera frugiperda]